MITLEPRHKKALQKAYDIVGNSDPLQARYLREVMSKLGVSSTAPVAKKTPKPSTVNSQYSFMRKMTPSKELAAVVGYNPKPRTEVIAKLWSYIKKHKLQDQLNKRMVNCDAKLKPIFGKAQISMFDMASHLGKHLK